LPAYAESEQGEAAKKRNSVAYDLATRAINLPSAMKLTEPDVDRVCSVFKRILGRS
jgi:dTDP-4-amino-4,6-dideoxygalactose transaminase